MRQDALFYRLGKFIYNHRLSILLVWIILIISCIPFIPHIIAPFKSTGFIDSTSASVKADDYLSKNLNYTNERILISYHSKNLRTSDPQFLKAIKQSLVNLKKFPIKHEVYYPDNNEKQISKDKHTAIVIITFATQEPLSQEHIKTLQTLIKKPASMTMLLGGEPIFVDSVNKQTQEDLLKADLVAAPVAIIILILIFGSLVAATLPIILGGGCALLILTALYFLGHAFTLSIFTLNIALLLGLCLSLDYCLFIVSRFRHELDENPNPELAIAATLATAGKAVFFSGLAVFVSLSALLIFPINILFSVGVGGLAAVFFAVAVAIILLPAILSILKAKINYLSVIPHHKTKPSSSHFWRWLAKKVVKHPLIYFILVLLFLLMLGYPFLSARFGISDFHILPKQAEGRQFFDMYKEKFDDKQLTPILLLVSTSQGNILSRTNLNKLFDFVQDLKDNPLISQVNSIVNVNSKLTKKSYYTLYHSSLSLKDSKVKSLLKTTTKEHATLISVVSKYPANSSETKRLISQLRLMTPGKDLSMQITGIPVNNSEVLAKISQLFPYALVWIMVLSYLILLILLRSIFLPLKAILMNIVSLCASYGVLVFIFQEGHLHQWLNFDPQGMLDISLLIIIFCAIFGFSMDYEVFLLTRIKEFYEKTHENNNSIILGIDHSSRIITSAAIIVIFICGSFMVADVLMVKEFGLGIAVAIFVDAFLVRSLLVPATMVLIKQLNWYCPKWLERILPRW